MGEVENVHRAFRPDALSVEFAVAFQIHVALHPGNRKYIAPHSDDRAAARSDRRS
jgi:hypothetical protein